MKKSLLLFLLFIYFFLSLTGSILTSSVNKALGVIYKMKDIVDAGSTSKRIMKVIKQIPKIDSEDKEGIILEHVSGQIEFKKVKFSYPSLRPESVIF